MAHSFYTCATKEKALARFSSDFLAKNATEGECSECKAVIIYDATVFEVAKAIEGGIIDMLCDSCGNKRYSDAQISLMTPESAAMLARGYSESN